MKERIHLSRNKERYTTELEELSVQFDEAKNISEKGVTSLSDFSEQIAQKEHEKVTY
ncbi:MAG: hypothetical protein MZV64_00820 [Ignavibacteriales bacterium]|nr:hypothetical protein [Ignavibacteriales bacterium]